MSNTRYRIAASARGDLVSIGQFTEIQWGRKQRQIIRNKLLTQFEHLADFPALGTTSGIAHPNSRSFLVHPFNVIYLADASGVTILRIFHQHQSRNLTNTSSDEEE